MSARMRTYFFVALAGVAAAALVVATVAFTRTSTGGGGSVHAETSEVRRRPPVLSLDLGVRTDEEARALRRGNALYNENKRPQAARIFSLYHSVAAQVGLAAALWPAATLPRLRRLAREHRRSAVALLHLGLAEQAIGNQKAARTAWRRAVARDPDTQSAVSADNLLHPEFAPELPPFVPSFELPPAVARLSPPRQFATLRRAARGDGVRSKLLYGAALQRLGRPVSAERQFAAAVRASPRAPEPRVAVAVGLFSKSNPVRAFARLGPLSGLFARSQTVRYHLGELLLWIGQVQKAKHQLRLARALGPRTVLGTSADRLLKRLRRLGPSDEN